MISSCRIYPNLLCQIKIQFLDDRKAKYIQDERERIQREDAAVHRNSQPPSSPRPAVAVQDMPGQGQTLIDAPRQDDHVVFHDDDDDADD